MLPCCPCRSPARPTGVWYLGPIPIRGYALCIILGIVVAIWIGERRWVARGGRLGEIQDLAIWAVPFGLVGAPALPRGHRPRPLLRRGQHPIEALYVWQRRPRHLGRGRAGRLGVYIGARRKGIRLLPDARRAGPRRARRPGDRPLGQLVQPGALRQARPTCRGAWRSTRRTTRATQTFPPGHPFHPTYLYEFLWNLGGLRAADLGRPPLPARLRPGRGALRDGLHRWAAAGSRTCASTPSSSTTSAACGSTSGPRSCCSWPRPAYFCGQPRRHPGREETVYRAGSGPEADEERDVEAAATPTGPGADRATTDGADAAHGGRGSTPTRTAIRAPRQPRAGLRALRPSLSTGEDPTRRAVTRW